MLSPHKLSHFFFVLSQVSSEAVVRRRAVVAWVEGMLAHLLENSFNPKTSAMQVSVQRRVSVKWVNTLFASVDTTPISSSRDCS